ncbi:MAG: TIGR02281 family clan AA aspartic protease [Pseudomonadota bacterium]
MAFCLRLPHLFALATAMLLAQGPASAQASAESVALAGMLGNRALLVVNGSPPKTVAAGDTHQGVRVISTSGDQAVIEQSGKRITLRVGDAPVSMGGNSGGGARGNRIVLPAGQGGHFFAAGSVNGKAAQFMVDTGATAIAMSHADAERAGINYKNGQQTHVGTANGTVPAYRIKLDSVRIGDVEIFGVDALVVPNSMPYMLLGNSFLSRFQMTRDNDQMTLTRRY